jgi:hypothetical protein
VSATDSLEAAVLTILGRPGVGWFATSPLARQLRRGRREVDQALRALAERGVLERGVERTPDKVVTVWRFAGGSR